jgi:hypothetical protein
MDPHEVMLHPKKSDILILENENDVKLEHCTKHNRFRKNCLACREAVA